jgi:molecular chaperone HscB
LYLVGSATNTHYLQACEKIQPPNSKSTFFDFLSVPKSFDLDIHRLEKNYWKKQRVIHPDKFGVKSSEEQEYSLQQAESLNVAYETLRKPVMRAQYMLSLVGIEIGEGSDSSDLPADVLFEVMETREELSLAHSDADIRTIAMKNNSSQQNAVQTISQAFQQGDFAQARVATQQLMFYSKIAELCREKLDSVEHRILDEDSGSK